MRSRDELRIRSAWVEWRSALRSPMPDSLPALDPKVASGTRRFSRRASCEKAMTRSCSARLRLRTP